MRVLLLLLPLSLLFASAQAQTPATLVEQGRAYYFDGAYKEAAERFAQAAAAGDPAGQFELGRLYLYGEGVPRNDSEAVVWLLKAAEQGEVNAQFFVGNCYHGAQGVTHSPERALFWWNKAAKQGHKEAQQRLQGAYGKRYGGVETYEDLEHLERAAAAGDPKAAEALRYNQSKQYPK